MVALGACATTGSVSTGPKATIDTVIAEACPYITLEATLGIKLNKAEAKALKAIKLACPPNAPPDNLATAAVDAVEAYTILEPLFVKAKAKHA
jgi:hypothetical protein